MGWDWTATIALPAEAMPTTSFRFCWFQVRPPSVVIIVTWPYT